MKYFHISLGFKLKDRPAWLEDFPKEYDKPYPYHLTLKNETCIEDQDIPRLKKILEKIVKGYNPKELEMIFDKIDINETSKGHCIMVVARDDLDIRKLQLEIVRKLGIFGDNSSKEHKKFEENFTPHITIGRHLNDAQLLQAKKNLLNNIRFEIEPEKIVLAIVDRPILEERVKEQNRDYFYFDQESKQAIVVL